jgi:hypothetical protein
MFWLLVACGTEVGGGGETPIDVSVAPLTLSTTLDAYTSDDLTNCDRDSGFIQSLGFTYVVNDGPDPAQIDVYATHTRTEAVNPVEGGEDWIDVSVDEDLHRNLEPGGQMDIELFIMAQCYAEDGTELDRFRVYVFEVEILVADEPTVVRGEVRLTPAE